MITKSRHEAKFYDGEDGRLYFYLMRTSIADVGCQPFVLECLAEEKHIKDYSKEHDEYLANKIALENLESAKFNAADVVA